MFPIAVKFPFLCHKNVGFIRQEQALKSLGTPNSQNAPSTPPQGVACSRCWELGELKNIRAVRQDPVCTQESHFIISGSERMVKILKQGFYLFSRIHIVLSYNDSRYFCYPCKCSIPFGCFWNNSNLKWKIKYLCLVQKGYCKKWLDEIKADELQTVQEEIPRQWDVLNKAIKL